MSQFINGISKNKVGAIGGAIVGWYLSGKIPFVPLVVRLGLTFAGMAVGAELEAMEKEGAVYEAMKKNTDNQSNEIIDNG